jgi:fructokinase
MRRIYGLGETVLDIIFKKGQPVAAKAGGSVLNAFVSLGRLGMIVHFISEYGTEPVGELIDRFLNENNVSTQYITRYKDGKSTLALAFLDEKNNASYTFYKDYPQDRLTNLPGKFMQDDILMFGSIYAITAAVRKQLLTVLQLARSAGALILYDPNFRAAHLHELEALKPLIIENMQLADIIRGSDEDFMNIFGAAGSDEAYDAVHDYCPNLVYTANREGVFIHSDRGRYHFPIKTIKPVSTIGAGDNFNAGMVFSIIRQSIKAKDLPGLEYDQWQCIADSGIRLATHVCLSYDNYISREFAEEFVR